jgi:uncharacterized membrane protein
MDQWRQERDQRFRELAMNAGERKLDVTQPASQETINVQAVSASGLHVCSAEYP